MVSHDNFLRDPSTSLEIPSDDTSPLESPSFSLYSTQSEYSQISEYSSGTSSSFTFPTIQRNNSHTLTLSSNRSYYTCPSNVGEDTTDEEERDKFSIFPLCQPNKRGGASKLPNLLKPTSTRASDLNSYSEAFDSEEVENVFNHRDVSLTHKTIDIKERITSSHCETCATTERANTPSKLREMFSRRQSRSRISSGIRSRLSSLTQSNESSSMEESSACSTTSSDKSNLQSPKPKYWIMVLGAKGSGKTSIIQQFLYDQFDSKYKPTPLEQMYYGEFDIHGRSIEFDIQDVSGGYVDEFPPMRKVSFEKADAFVLTFALDSYESWLEVERLREMIHSEKGDNVPIVIVGNKSDLKTTRDDRIPQENALDACISLDWDNGYVQSSAKDRHNINKIFKELLQQSKSLYYFDTPSSASSNQESSPLNTPVKIGSQPVGFDWMKTKTRPHASINGVEDCLKRRISLPAMCPSNPLTTPQYSTDNNTRAKNNEVGKTHACGKKRQTSTKSQFASEHENVLSHADSNTSVEIQTPDSRRLSFAATTRKDSCRIS